MIRKFDEWLNESKIPTTVKKMANDLRVEPELDIDMEGVWNLSNDKFQILFNTNKDNSYGKYGWQVATTDGQEIFTGTNTNRLKKILGIN